MRRRTALGSMLLGALAPGWAAAQQSRSGRSNNRLAPVDSDRPAREERDRVADASADDAEPADDPSFSSPEGFDEPGHRWRTFNIARYTDLPHSRDTIRPQDAIVEWIFRRTSSQVWHGAETAALNVTADKLRAYHNEQVLDQVTEMVERFVDSVHDTMSMRVRFVAASNPKWRYALFSQLEPLGAGPHGQQIWTVDVGTAEAALAQVGLDTGSKKLYDERRDLVNGQTLAVNTTYQQDIEYVSGLERTSAAGTGYEPKTSKLREGIDLRISPLMNYDGTALDLALDLRAFVVYKLLPVKVVAPRKVGPAEMNIEVPQVGETRLNQTIIGWPFDRALVISAGILPGILQNKNGLLNLRIPGTTPTTTELLVILNATTRSKSDRTASRGSSRSRDADSGDIDVEARSSTRLRSSDSDQDRVAPPADDLPSDPEARPTRSTRPQGSSSTSRRPAPPGEESLEIK